MSMLAPANRLACIAAALAALYFVPAHLPTAMAQPAVISPEVTERGSMTAADEAAIAAYVAAHKGGLSGDVEQVKAARTALLRPLSNPKVTSNFRLAYGVALKPVIEPLAADAKDYVAVNALRVAGELATTNTLPMLLAQLEAGAKDRPISVRYAACFGLTRMFDAFVKADVALAPANLKDAVNALAAFIERSSEPQLIDGATLALIAAGQITDAKSEAGFRAMVVSKMSAALSGKATAIATSKDPSATMSTLLRGVTAIRDLILADAASNSPLLTLAAVKDSAGVSGDVLAAVVRLQDKQAGGGAAAPGLAADRAALASSTVIGLVLTRLDTNAPMVPKDIRKIIAPDGVLTSPPLGFPADRFKI